MYPDASALGCAFGGASVSHAFLAPIEGWYVPAAHETHEVSNVAVLVLYVPAGQFRHSGWATPVWYVPVGHTGQLVPPLFSWYVPLVVQFVHTEAPALAENVPTSHSWHEATEAAPVAVENLPGTHEVQTDTPAAEYFPATQDKHDT